MRPSIAVTLLLLAQQAAVAHVPGGEQTLVETISHQVFSLHHLPIILAFGFVAAVLASLRRHKIVGETAKKR